MGINKNHYSFFKIGDLCIKFYTSPYLQKFCCVDCWKDNGYIEYTGMFSTSKEPVRDSIDLEFIADRLHLPKSVFGGIEEVRIV